MTPKTEQKVYVGIGMDFETGGLDCRECACTQIALQAVRFDTWQVFDHCQAYIAPYGKADAGLPRRKVLRTRHEQVKEAGVVPMKYEQTALDYSAITMEMLRTQGVDMKTAAGEIIAFAKRSALSKGNQCKPILIGQNVTFDIGFLQQLMNYAGLVAEFEKTFAGTKDYYGNFQPHYIDTLTVGRLAFAADPEVVGPNAKAAVEAMKDGEVVLLENTRYRAEETKNGEAFSKDLASLCDVYVDDAFGTAHRAHCSNVGVTQYVDTAVVGYLMQKEIDFLGNAVDNPVRPFVAILGGAKVADKLNVISNLLEKCDTLIIGGGMAFTFLKAQGKEIGKSLVDDTKLDYCREMVEKAAKLGKKLLLPVDAAVAASFPDPIDAPIEVQNVSVDAIPADTMGLDIGPETAKLYADTVKSAKTVVWNGPMGVFENPTLAQGTIAVAKALADTEATTIIGGGDSAAAVNQLGFGDKMTHISTGGGASLEFLEGKELPGVAAANDK